MVRSADLHRVLPGTGQDLLYPVLSPMTMYQVYDERGSLAEMAPRWRELAAVDPSASIFQSPDYAAVWWEEFGALRSLSIVEVMGTDGELRGIAPLSMEPDGSVHFVGDPSITDYLAPVSRPQDRELVSSILVEAATKIEGFTRLTLSGLPRDSGWPEPLVRAAKAAGLVTKEEEDGVCPVLVIGESWDAYLQSLAGKQRHEIRRKARRLEDAGGYTVRVSSRETLDRDLDTFFAMHRSAAGPKGKFMHENMAVYFRNLAHAMDARGWMRLAILEIEGASAAGMFGFSDGRTWCIYNSSYDHARRELAPGLVLLAETIRLAADEGCRTYDFLRGGDEYKFRFGAKERAVVRVIGETS
ncbi:MAG: hypothetical protein NVSMB57_01490 [Actinomycetota bacterium]